VVAVVAPSGPVDPERLARGVRVLEDEGFVVRTSQLAAHRYFAAAEGARRRELLEAFAAPDVVAVWCARGGYGAQRLLPGLDAEWLRRHAKLCIGFSDATAVLGFLVERAGVAAVHGPMVAHDLVGGGSSRSLRHVLELLSGAADWRIEVPIGLVAGEAEAPLVGGCLTVLASLAGTPFAPRFAGSIALLEDTNERPLRRVDRLLTQLRQSGMLSGVRGIVFGTMPDCGPREELCETISDCLADLGVPIGFGVPVGHGDEHLAVPLGVRVRLSVTGTGLAALTDAERRGHLGAGSNGHVAGFLSGREPVVS
jgi:muramoyltetrapeptide carboxypeptidase